MCAHAVRTCARVLRYTFLPMMNGPMFNASSRLLDFRVQFWRQHSLSYTPTHIELRHALASQNCRPSTWQSHRTHKRCLLDTRRHFTFVLCICCQRVAKRLIASHSQLTLCSVNWLVVCVCVCRMYYGDKHHSKLFYERLANCEDHQMLKHASSICIYCDNNVSVSDTNTIDGNMWIVDVVRQLESNMCVSVKRIQSHLFVFIEQKST